MNTISKMRLTGVLLSLLLTACGGAGGGGGSGGGSGPVNTAPIARAGTDQSVLAGSLVSLDGSASSDAERVWRSTRSEKVARPFSLTQALKGDMAGPVWRSGGVI